MRFGASSVVAGPVLGAAAALAAIALSGCVRLDFSRKVTEEERLLRDEVGSYYAELGAAFAAGNADALADLFAPELAKPMTREQLRAWGRDFFAAHGPARFKVEKLDFLAIGHVSADVEVTYRVETRGGDGSFRSADRDALVKRGRRWFVASWEKIPEPPARR